MDSRSSAGLKIDGLIFWVAAFFVLFWALGVRELWGSEDRWAEISRMMLSNGRYFHPEINGEVYFDKPLLSYWFIAISSFICGSLSEFAIRLPSVISAIIALWGVNWLGSRLWSENVGRAAGWILLSSYGFLFWSRTASADMENLAFIVLAVCWYWAIERKPGFFGYFLFYLICFTGAHAKGLITVAVPVAIVLADAMKDRRWKYHVNAANIIAGVIAFGLYLGPFIYASMSNPAAEAQGVLDVNHENGLYMVFRENIQRFFKPFDHVEPFYIYFYYLPLLFAPWILIFLGGLFEQMPSIFSRRERATGWLAGAVIVTFLFFTISGSRRGYYILPILPFCALVVAVYANSELQRDGLRRACTIITSIALFLTGAALLLTPFFWSMIENKYGFTPPAEVKYIMPISGTLGLAALFSFKYASDLVSWITGTPREISHLVAAAFIMAGSFFCFQMPEFDSLRTERSFAYELRDFIDENGYKPEEVAFFRKAKTNILYYMNLKEPVKVLDNAEEAEEFIKLGRGIFVAQEGDLKHFTLPAFVENNKVLTETFYPWEGKRISRKHLVWLVQKETAKSAAKPLPVSP